MRECVRACACQGLETEAKRNSYHKDKAGSLRKSRHVVGKSRAEGTGSRHTRSPHAAARDGSRSRRCSLWWRMNNVFSCCCERSSCEEGADDLEIKVWIVEGAISAGTPLTRGKQGSK